MFPNNFAKRTTLIKIVSLDPPIHVYKKSPLERAQVLKIPKHKRKEMQEYVEALIQNQKHYSEY